MKTRKDKEKEVWSREADFMRRTNRDFNHADLIDMTCRLAFTNFKLCNGKRFVDAVNAVVLSVSDESPEVEFYAGLMASVLKQGVYLTYVDCYVFMDQFGNVVFVFDERDGRWKLLADVSDKECELR